MTADEAKEYHLWYMQDLQDYLLESVHLLFLFVSEIAFNREKLLIQIGLITI